MNNTIDAARSNTNFQARYLRISHSDTFPQVIKDAIYKSDAIDRFINAGNKKKNLWEKFLDFFRKDEVLEIEYCTNPEIVKGESFLKPNPKDPYEAHAMLRFRFGKNIKNFHQNSRYFDIKASQHGVFRNKFGHGVILKKGENPYYDEPKETVEELIVKKIEELRDLNKNMKKMI